MIKTKDITILGSGISGLGSAKLAKKFGINVFVSDKNSIKEKVKKHLNNNKISFKENGHDVERLLKSDEVIISPGISFSNLKKSFPNIKEEKLFEIIKNDEKIIKYLDQVEIKRKIYIKDKLLNIII